MILHLSNQSGQPTASGRLPLNFPSHIQSKEKNVESDPNKGQSQMPPFFENPCAKIPKNSA